MKEPYIKIVIPAHDQESIRQYLHDYRFRFVVNDLLNLIRQELKYDPVERTNDDGKKFFMCSDTLQEIRKKIIDLADEYKLDLD